jgi:signal peptidase I
MENENQPNYSSQNTENTVTPTLAPQPEPATPPQPQLTPTQPPEKKKKEAGIVSFIATLAVAFILVQVINMFFFQSYKVFGSSMFPTLHDGDRLIISKVGKTGSKLRGKDYVPKRGDIIVFQDPQRDDLQLIKRVIGLPGERVVVKDGSLTVYNEEHPDGFNPDTSGAYKADLPTTSGENDVTVPDKNLFVSGDNREGSNSLDSRNELGTVPEDLVIGTLKVRLFPFNSAKFF